MGKITLHSDATKIRCAYLYAEHGNYSKVARDTKIARQTIQSWGKDSQVWVDALGKARQEISDELLAQNLAIATRANEELIDRINNGDHKVFSSGLKAIVPMSGKDLAVVSGIKEDKARVGMGLATVIRSDSSSKDSVLKFLDQISDTYRKQVQIKDSVVSTQEPEE